MDWNVWQLLVREGFVVMGNWNSSGEGFGFFDCS